MRRTVSWLSMACLVACLVVLSAPARSEVTQQDLILMGLIFRNQSGPYLEQPDANPRVQELVASAGSFRRGDVDRAATFKALAEGISLMAYGEWNEGREVASFLDMRIPAKLYEAGDTVKVRVFPVYEREGRFKQHYLISLKLVDQDGKAVGEPGRVHLHQPATKEVALSIPGDLASGAYSVHYSLAPHHGPEGPPLLEGARTLFVVAGLKSRLNKLAELQRRITELKTAAKSKSHELAARAVDWHLAIYEKGLEEDVAGAYTDHPLFMTSVMSQAGMRIERIDFLNELAQAEELAAALVAGKDPLKTRTGDLRLAYVSPVDEELVPFRLFVPQGYDGSKVSPLVVGLHGAGGDENSFMDRYAGLFKANAQKRGYIAVSVNGRGPYGGYRGKSGQDVLDVIDWIEAVYPIDPKRIYLTGHSMGGGGTVLVGFDHAQRFAALAPVAGFGNPAQVAKAKDMPILLAQGEKDALVPVERARSFYKAAQEAGLPVKYIEKEGVDHILIVDLVMDDIFDWFDRHTK